MRAINKVVIHCSASVPSAGTTAATIDEWHRKRGFSRIGYHYVILTNGMIQEGRNVADVGAHAEGHNKDSIGICLVGGVDNTGKPADNFSAAQKAALLDLLKTMQLAFPKAQILGHRDLSPDLNHDGQITPNEWMKQCPSFDVRAWMKDVGLRS